MQDPKNWQKVAIWAPSYNFVGLYLRNEDTYGQSENKLVKQRRPHNMVNFGLLTAEICWRVSLLGSVTAWHLVVGVSQTLRR